MITPNINTHACRRCSECPDASHHWMPDFDAGEWEHSPEPRPIWACKHCSFTMPMDGYDVEGTRVEDLYARSVADGTLDLHPLAAARATGLEVSLPSDGAPESEADRLSLEYGSCPGGEYGLSVRPVGEESDHVFEAPVYSSRNAMVTWALAALYHRARGDVRSAAANLRRAMSCDAPPFGARTTGDTVSLPSWQGEDRLYILTGDDYYVSVFRPVRSFPAGVPCFRACTSGTRNPFVTTIVAAIHRYAKFGDIAEARGLLSMELKQLERLTVREADQRRGSES